MCKSNNKCYLWNRFRFILETHSNFMFLQGYEGEPRAYIATQGAMAHTVMDFWRMIWFEKCPIIVMITKLKEKSKVSSSLSHLTELSAWAPEPHLCWIRSPEPYLWWIRSIFEAFVWNIEIVFVLMTAVS